MKGSTMKTVFTRFICIEMQKYNGLWLHEHFIDNTAEAGTD